MALSLAKRLVRSLAVFIVVTFATFSLMYGNGPGIAHAVLGLNATPEAIQAEVVKLGLDRPLLVQYWDWLSGVARGDLGSSFYTSESVSSALSNRVPVTLALVFLTLLLTAALSVILGVTAAVRGGGVDRVLPFISLLGTPGPALILGLPLLV